MFSHIECGETLPVGNVHAVSVSIPCVSDIISYEEGKNSAIKSGYPRFVLHPYLKKMAKYLEEKYMIDITQEIVLVSSQNFADLITKEHKIEQVVRFEEEFGVILLKKNTDQLKNVLSFIQHVGCNLSSRFAEDYLYQRGLIDALHVEVLEVEERAHEVILETLSIAYNNSNIHLATSGMNAMYTALKGLQEVRSGLVIQLGWLYLDSSHLIEAYDNKVFYDVNDLIKLEEFLSQFNGKVSCLVTEVPSNPLLQCADLKQLKNICLKYDIDLVIDSTFATAYTKIEEADILIESLTKFACGNADVLMGCLVLGKKYNNHVDKFLKNLDKPYIKDLQRLAFEIKGYRARVKKANKNRALLVEFLETKNYIEKVYSSSLSPVISVTFSMPFKDAYDTLNFCKGPSLGTEFTLLMPYVYLAYYKLLICEEGREILKQNGIPTDLVRISVGTEDIEDIKKEFDRLDLR